MTLKHKACRSKNVILLECEAINAYQFKMNGYKYRMKCINLVVTRNQKPIKDTQNIEKGTQTKEQWKSANHKG